MRERGRTEKIDVKLRKRTAAAAAQAWGFYTSHIQRAGKGRARQGAGGMFAQLERWTKLFALVKRQQTWSQLQWHKRNITNLHKMLKQSHDQKRYKAYSKADPTWAHCVYPSYSLSSLTFSALANR